MDRLDQRRLTGPRQKAPTRKKSGWTGLGDASGPVVAGGAAAAPR